CCANGCPRWIKCRRREHWIAWCRRLSCGREPKESNASEADNHNNHYREIPSWVGSRCRRIVYISIQVSVTSTKSNVVQTDKAPDARIVVACSVVVQPAFRVELASSEFEAVSRE